MGAATVAEFGRRVRVLFEGGLEATRDSTGEWFLHTWREPEALGQQWDLGPVYGRRPIVVFDTEGGLPFAALLRFGQYEPAFRLGAGHNTMWEWLHACPPGPVQQWAMDVGWVMCALFYHLLGLAEGYAAAARTHPGGPQEGLAPDPHRRLDPDAGFEFDALLTSGRRLYECIGYLLWNGLRCGGGKPRSFEATYQKVESRLPEGAQDGVGGSWETYGRALRYYRDFVLHTSPLHAGPAPIMRLLPLGGGVLAASWPLPDNPEGKCRRKFTFTLGRDALSWGWEVATALRDASWTTLHLVCDAQGAA